MRFQRGAQEPDRSARRTNPDRTDHHARYPQDVRHWWARPAGIGFRTVSGQHAGGHHGGDEETGPENGERQKIAADRVEGATDHWTGDQTEAEERFEGGLWGGQIKLGLQE